MVFLHNRMQGLHFGRVEMPQQGNAFKACHGPILLESMAA
jgi:hypothetical protein